MKNERVVLLRDDSAMLFVLVLFSEAPSPLLLRLLGKGLLEEEREEEAATRELEGDIVNDGVQCYGTAALIKMVWETVLG